MVLDADQARSASGCSPRPPCSRPCSPLVASAPLGRDAQRLESAVRRLEAGDRTARTGVHRADELGHVARALDELTERLDVLERERATFEDERRRMLTSVGHDLRTPLSALRAAVEALADGVAPDPRALPAGDGPRRRGARARSSTTCSCSPASSRAGSSSAPRPVDLSELADEAVEALAPAATARTGRRLACESPGGVARQRQRTAIGRVIRNLVDNAIRHAPRGLDRRVVVAGPTATVRGHRSRARVSRRVLRPRLRALRPRRPEPDPRDRRRRARPGHRPRAGRGARRPDLDRAASRRRAAWPSSCPPPDAMRF